MKWQEIDGWFNWRPGQELAVQHFSNGSRFVEVGTYLGRSICSLAEVVASSGKNFTIIGIDTCQGSGPEGIKQKNYHQAAVEAGGGTFAGILHRNLLACDAAKHVNLIISDSLSAAKLFPDAYFDWVHLDARHDYQSVHEDIQAWLPKVKASGWISGDDYNSEKWPGLVKAVQELLPAAKPWLHEQWRYCLEEK